MASASNRAKKGWNEVSSVLHFDQNPRRRLMVIGVVALLVVAVLIVAVHSVYSGSGCNAVLSVQRYSCLATLAVRTGSVPYCDQIGNSGMRESCIMAVAESGRNVSACTSFPQGQYRTNCIENISLVSSNPSLCDGLDVHNQSLCRYTLASGSNFSEPSYCSGIREAYYGVLCSGQSYYHLALKTGNDSYCGDLPSALNSTLTYSMSIQNPDSQGSRYGVLASLVNVTPRDFCYSSLANRTSYGSCSRISNSTLRSSCNATTLVANSTFSVQNATADCSNETSSLLKNLCYFGVYSNEALSTSNESWCGRITNMSYSTSCIVNLASSTGNTSYCNSLQDPSSVQSCLEEVQLSGGNYT